MSVNSYEQKCSQEEVLALKYRMQGRKLALSHHHLFEEIMKQIEVHYCPQTINSTPKTPKIFIHHRNIATKSYLNSKRENQSLDN